MYNNFNLEKLVYKEHDMKKKGGVLVRSNIACNCSLAPSVARWQNILLKCLLTKKTVCLSGKLQAAEVKLRAHFEHQFKI